MSQKQPAYEASEKHCPTREREGHPKDVRRGEFSPNDLLWEIKSYFRICLTSIKLEQKG